MRVGINVLHLVPNETGGSELYARRLVPALLETAPDLRLVLFCPREARASLAAEPWGSNVELVPVPVQARSRPRRVLAEQLLLRGAARRARIDLLHNAFTTAPVLPGVPQVTTILDVTYKRFPETHPGLLRYGMVVLAPLAARRSRRVLTLSEAAKDDIVRFLGVDADRIDVTPLGPSLHEPAAAMSPVEVRRRFDLGAARLVLTVSAKRPHKNLGRLFEAFASLADEDAVLLVPGYATAFEADLQAKAAALGVGDRILFTGWVDDEALDGLYRAADCLVFPTLAEGFGLPVLDALVRGTPVVCSRIPVLEEVSGDAALYFDPLDVADIASALRRALDDGALAARLREAGPERARLFSWTRTAETTIASYERALASIRPRAGSSPG